MAEPWETEAADGRIVIEDYPQPEVRLDYFGGASGTYAGFDRFGRVIQQLWYDHGASEERDKFSYGFDRNSSRLYRKNEHTNGTNFSELYHANGAAANQAYDGWGNVSTSWQAHAGAADTSGGGQSPKVLYAYEDGQVSNEAKYVRLDSVTYPSGRVVYYNYPTTGTGVGRALARLDNMASSATPNDADKYVEYTTFLGAGTVVELEYPAVTVSTNPLVLTYGGSGTYAGFDRFGRITDQKWQIKTAGTVKDRYTYGYDYNSNRMYRKNEHTHANAAKLSELYHANGAGSDTAYDGLDRLKEFRRGTLTGTPPDTISSDITRVQEFGLESLGNWRSFKEDANGIGWDLDQARTHNKVNETDGITGGSWIVPTHDSAGNMTQAPRPGDEDSTTKKLICTYDAWNRLVFVEPKTDDLQVHWKLDDGSGQAATDSSGNNNNGTLYPAPDGQEPPVWTTGRRAGGLDFDGTDDYVICDTNLTTTAYTVSLWVKAGAVHQTDGSGVFNNDDNNGTSNSFQIDVDGTDPGDYRWYHSATDKVNIGTVVTDWVHLAVTYAATKIRVYYNGKFKAELDVDDGDSGKLFDHYVIGANRGRSEHFDGIIDDVRVYSRALTAGEIGLLSGYAYDGLNRRIVRGGQDFYYNTAWQVVEVRKDGDTDPLKQYVWDIRYIDSPIVRFHDSDMNGTLNDTLYYCNDANFNVTALVRGDPGHGDLGKVVERYIYDPYGKVTVLNGEADADDGGVADWSVDAQGKSDWDNEVLYCGYRYDPETGLYHVRWRMYHPTLGRWLQRDPSEYVDGMSLYEYVGSSPVVWIDWEGIRKEKPQKGRKRAEAVARRQARRAEDQKAKAARSPRVAPKGTKAAAGTAAVSGLAVAAEFAENVQEMYAAKEERRTVRGKVKALAREAKTCWQKKGFPVLQYFPRLTYGRWGWQDHDRWGIYCAKDPCHWLSVQLNFLLIMKKALAESPYKGSPHDRAGGFYAGIVPRYHTIELNYRLKSWAVRVGLGEGVFDCCKNRKVFWASQKKKAAQLPLVRLE